jgi:predicted homoserine dehydrogenase-like protein
MIIIDKALEKIHDEGKPIRLAWLVLGFMGQGIAFQMINAVKGIKLIAICNRNLERARNAYIGAGVQDIRTADTLTKLSEFIAYDHFTITEDAMLLCKAHKIDAILEVTGSIEHAAHVVLEAIKNGKDVISMNAELDGTLDPY